MRDNNGKNIYSQVLPHTLAQMDTAKAHTHIAMRCELTAVFPCFISCGNFVSSTESCRSIYYILRCKDSVNQAKYQRIIGFLSLHDSRPLSRDSKSLYLRDKTYLSRIQNIYVLFYGLILFVVSRFDILYYILPFLF